MNHILLQPKRFFYRHWLLILGATGFCSHALGEVPFGGESSERPAEFWTPIVDADVVYIGETHTSRTDHEYELELIRALIRNQIHFAIGWEMFERTQQSDLNRFDEGRLSMADLFTRTGFEKSWATYSPLYAKILETTVHANLANIGLNAPPALAHKLATGEPLSLSQKKQVPTEFRIPVGAYRHFVRLMGEHPGMKPGNLHRFFAAQNVWDETMAKAILEFQRKNPNTKLLVLTGRGHRLCRMRHNR